MTGYKSKRAMSQAKLGQWDTPSEAFNAWWNSDYNDSTNPFMVDTYAYWAWAGWQAALAQPVQNHSEDNLKMVAQPEQEPMTIDKAMRLLGGVLAQPVQEPVAWMGYDNNLKMFASQKHIADASPELYTVALYPHS